MSIAFTYNSLIAALQAWPEDEGDNYVENLPTIIGMGESRVVVDLNLELFDVSDSSIVVTGNSRLVPKPANLLSTRSLWLITDGVTTPLLLRSRDWCENFAPDATVLTVPRYYCEYSESYWLISGTPNASRTAKAIYLARPLGLSSSTQHTWLGDYVGDLLFAACLMESEHFLKADDRYEDIKKKYYEELLPMRRMELTNMIRTGQYSPYVPAATKAE